MPIVLPVHIAAAAVGLLSGGVALAAAKGRGLHRGSGVVFVYAMITMCASAIVGAIARGQAVNVIAGSMTAYLVLTGWWAVRPAAGGSRRRDLALMLMALALGSATFALGLFALTRPRGMLFGMPSFPFFLFGVLGTSGAYGDWQALRAGALKGRARLARHLWRMCMALLIAAGSFFSIKRRVEAVFPAPLTSGVARLVPVVLVLGVMLYWLWRVRARALPARA